jgi:hypothetical protein
MPIGPSMHTLWRMGALLLAGYRVGIPSSGLFRYILILAVIAGAIAWIRRGAD